MTLHKSVLCSICAILLVATSEGFAKKKAAEERPYRFTEVVNNPATPVKDQNISGTCWCFATISFIESELLRMNKGEFDLSEMFIVRHNYDRRIADNYIRRGKGNLGEGSIAHMAIKVIDQFGIVPESAYSGISYDAELHDHSELSSYVSAIANVPVSLRRRSKESFELQNALFDIYLGELPQTFEYEGQQYTPASFKEMLGIDCNDYVELTSFSHHPFYSRFSLEIPDNWDNELLYNLPLNDFMAVIDNALNNGYTVCWDGDVSEQGYVFNPTAISILPADRNLSKADIANSATLIEEVAEVTQESRQNGFETFVTTDDHLEHITGIATDEAGNRYYITKNSWGTDSNPHGGYHYMSEKYVMAKTVSILVHKDAIPKDIKAKLGLQ